MAQGGPVDCSLLTRDQARGLNCQVAKPTGPTIDPGGLVLSAADCDPWPNPYDEPARAARCSAWDRLTRPRPALPTYEVGAVYTHPYAHLRMTVLAVASSLEGVPVITAQYLTGTQLGEVFAFRVDRGAPWLKED